MTIFEVSERIFNENLESWFTTSVIGWLTEKLFPYFPTDPTWQRDFLDEVTKPSRYWPAVLPYEAQADFLNREEVSRILVGFQHDNRDLLIALDWRDIATDAYTVKIRANGFTLAIPKPFLRELIGEDKAKTAIQDKRFLSEFNTNLSERDV